jgi:hypothetical protein
MEPESSLLYSQVPATCPYPEPAQSEYVGYWSQIWTVGVPPAQTFVKVNCKFVGQYKYY